MRPDAGATSAAPKAWLVSGGDQQMTARIAGAARERGARIAVFADQVTTEADADRLVEEALAQLSGLDGLIAVVAATPVGAPHELSLASWQERVARPLREAFLLAQRAIEEFLAGCGGRLVFVIPPSPAGTCGNEVVEQGVVSLGRSIAKEYGRRGIASNVIVTAGDPGADGSDEIRRLVADAALFLASPDASFVNGETLVVRPEPIASGSPAGTSR